jgi:hypothetical protein
MVCFYCGPADEEEEEAAEPQQKRGKDIDIAEYLEKVFECCTSSRADGPLLQHHDEEEEEEEDKEEERDPSVILEKVLALDRKLASGHKMVHRQYLIRGYYIENNFTVGGEKLGDIAESLGLAKENASSNDAITVPREMFRLLNDPGLHMLKYFQPTREVTFKSLYTHRKKIREYFVENPDMLEQWQDEHVQYINVSAGRAWISYKWLME